MPFMIQKTSAIGKSLDAGFDAVSIILLKKVYSAEGSSLEGDDSSDVADKLSLKRERAFCS